jgi:SnoaL-like protein
MPMRTGAAVAVVVAALAATWWWTRADEHAVVRKRLTSLADEINSSAGEGLGSLTRAAQIGGYFTTDVVVDLGPGSAPIRGRDTVMAMAARLQPRTTAYTVKFADINVALDEAGTAGTVDLTAEFIQRAGVDDSLDAREFALRVVKGGGVWQIAEIHAVEPVRR